MASPGAVRTTEAWWYASLTVTVGACVSQTTASVAEEDALLPFALCATTVNV